MKTSRKRVYRKAKSAGAGFNTKQNNGQPFFDSGVSSEPGFFSAQNSAESINRKSENPENEEKNQEVQRSVNTSSPTAGGNVPAYISSLNGKGQPLPAQTNYFFSSRMNYDFNSVRVHTDQEAAESAKALHAKAYTTGNHVVFNEGQYNTESEEGKKLMAHELTHVTQQNAASPGRSNVQRKLKLTGTDDATRKKFVVKMNDGSSVAFELDASDFINLKDAKAVGADEYAKKMIAAIKDGQTINLKLIPKSATTFIDSFATGEIDSADMLGLSSNVFRSTLLHFLVERFAIKDYEKNKGSATKEDFKKGHKEGHEAQERFLQELFPKLTIKYKSEGYDNASKKVDKDNNGTIDYEFDFTDVKYVFTQPIVKGVTEENIVKSSIVEK